MPCLTGAENANLGSFLKCARWKWSRSCRWTKRKCWHSVKRNFNFQFHQIVLPQAWSTLGHADAFMNRVNPNYDYMNYNFQMYRFGAEFVLQEFVTRRNVYFHKEMTSIWRRLMSTDFCLRKAGCTWDGVDFCLIEMSSSYVLSPLEHE